MAKVETLENRQVPRKVELKKIVLSQIKISQTVPIKELACWIVVNGEGIPPTDCKFADLRSLCNSVEASI